MNPTLPSPEFRRARWWPLVQLTNRARPAERRWDFVKHGRSLVLVSPHYHHSLPKLF